MNKFSKQEKIDLSISIIVLTLIISFMYSRPNITVDKLLLFIPIAFVTVGLGFILHELGHKFVAQKYGFYAEFRRSDKGLMLGIVTALMGFLFFAPGAVMIGSPTGIISEEENGKISIAGPIVNIILALIFLGIQISIQPLVTLSNIDMMVYLYFLSVIGFNINSFLALFNLLPIPPLDGSKVISWNLPIWLISIVISGLLTLSAYIH
ncbi:MAG: site-2 protease family protein [Methanosphaera sp.]|nr:site-2 protease family protein [Methanosphaera sp.]